VRQRELHVQEQEEHRGSRGTVGGYGNQIPRATCQHEWKVRVPK
jgi:hypothetical protein